jgi:hypothetical protein
MLFQKWFAAASRREAFDLSLGTLPESAEPAEIVIPSLAEQENLDLMMGNTDTGPLEHIGDRPAAGTIESGQIVEAIDRNGEVDAVAPEELEARHSRTSGRANEPNSAIPRTAGILARSAAIASAARRNAACRASIL